MMLNDIYIALTIALVSALFVAGLLFHVLSSNMESSVFRTALRMMVFTYCFFGMVSLLELGSRTFLPASDDILLFQVATLVVAMTQAFLFTHTLILLIHTATVTRRKMLRELAIILILSAALIAACFTLPADWIRPTVRLFILFYIFLLIRYTRLFVVTCREALRRMDNFFSGQEARHLRWVHFSFYAALSIGLLALTSGLFPNMLIGTVCSVVYLFFYLNFAVRLINFGFVYKQLEEALSDDAAPPQDTDCDPNVRSASHSRTIEVKLEAWIKAKQFVQFGVTIDDLARQIGTNRSYLSKHINSTEGKTFRQWINELRIEEAKTLLRQYPEMPVSEIAKKVGFVNKSHFGRTFLALTRSSPHIWRTKR